PGEGEGWCEAGGFRHRMAKATLERRRPYRDDWWPVEHNACVVSVTFRIEPQLFQEFRHIGRRGGLAAVTTRKSQIRFQHTRHFIDIPLHRVDFRRGLDQCKLELEARKHSAQIV